jgi:hypothetical protein
LKTSKRKKFPAEKIMKKPDEENFYTEDVPRNEYEKILQDFDAYCDEFEDRAAEAFLRGDQNDGRVTKAAAEVGERPPSIIREIAEPGPTDIAIRATNIDVSAPIG